MNKSLIATMIFVAACGTATTAMAGDAEICLDCHEPAEDWAGMSSEELLTASKDAGNKRHKDNADLTDEQLKAIFAELMPE